MFSDFRITQQNIKQKLANYIYNIECLLCDLKTIVCQDTNLAFQGSPVDLEFFKKNMCKSNENRFELG